ncbi:MAG: septum formation initiator family protein [Rhodospirillales bacterium]|nr:septum formation initiator family protein [Rhodospirillales bacterium]MDE1883061.1 septum formation initiator family protein [Rhodospirillales bacterium]MDE2458294.1 septum formation initiator family protein [Rhodospirillales bacterium]
MLRALKYRLRGLIAPSVFLALTYYFGWNAVHGESGLEAQAAQRQQLQAAQSQQAAVHKTLLMWQTKVAALSGQSIQPDMLNEEAREVLNLANPNDLVIDLPQQKTSD